MLAHALWVVVALAGLAAAAAVVVKACCVPVGGGDAMPRQAPHPPSGPSPPLCDPLPSCLPLTTRREGFQAAVGRAELRAWCKGRIARFKVPRHWKLVDSFPLTVSGKPMKYKMREAAIAELGLAGAATAALPPAAAAPEQQL